MEIHRTDDSNAAKGLQPSEVAVSGHDEIRATGKVAFQDAIPAEVQPQSFSDLAWAGETISA